MTQKRVAHKLSCTKVKCFCRKNLEEDDSEESDFKLIMSELQ